LPSAKRFDIAHVQPGAVGRSVMAVVHQPLPDPRAIGREVWGVSEVHAENIQSELYVCEDCR
jgi:hypothetical protein